MLSGLLRVMSMRSGSAGHDQHNLLRLGREALVELPEPIPEQPPDLVAGTTPAPTSSLTATSAPVPAASPDQGVHGGVDRGRRAG